MVSRPAVNVSSVNLFPPSSSDRFSDISLASSTRHWSLFFPLKLPMTTRRDTHKHTQRIAHTQKKEQPLQRLIESDRNELFSSRKHSFHVGPLPRISESETADPLLHHYPTVDTHFWPRKNLSRAPIEMKNHEFFSRENSFVRCD